MGTDTNWLSAQKKKKVRAEKLEEREAKRMKYEQKQLEELKENVSVPLEYEGDDFIDIDDQVSEKCMVRGQRYADPKDKAFSQGTQTDSGAFPKVSVRTSDRIFKPEVLQTCVNLQAKHHVNASRCTPIIAEVANNIFGQSWCTRLGNNDVSDALPSECAVKNAIEDAAILRLKEIGEKVLKNREEGGKNTLHFDDTIKKSGSKSFDVKTVLITTAKKTENGEKIKNSHSLGFEENLSHKASDGAETIKNMLSRIAVLIGVSYEEFLDLMDYSMTDRGGDVDALLDELGLPKEDRMKCNAHILLCIDSSLNKAFKDFEVKVGVENILGHGLESTHVL